MPRPLRSLLPPVLPVAALLVALAAACGGDGAPASPQPVAGASIESIETEDGLHLDARLFAGGSAAARARLVILLHMYPADQRSWYDLAWEIQARGEASALTLDFRGYGASEGERDVAQIDRDVRAALAFAHRRGYRSVALVGASMGGTAAIVVAAEEPLAGVITLSAPVRFRGLDAGSAVGRVAAPLAVIAARGDRSAADSLDTLAERAGLDARHALLFEGSAHGTDLLSAANGAEVGTRMLALLDEFWAR